MASSVATPLERQFGRIAGVTEMTSSSTLGSTQHHAAVRSEPQYRRRARDVQAAINAARGYLPANLPSNPTYRKVNPADSPIFMLALTSDSAEQGPDVRRRVHHHGAEAVAGAAAWGRSVVGGSALPGVRVELNPDGAEQVRHRPGAGAHRAGRGQRQHAQGPLFRRAAGCGKWAPTIRSSRPSITSRWSSPIATAPRSASPMSARRSIRWKTCATPATPTASRRSW